MAQELHLVAFVIFANKVVLPRNSLLKAKHDSSPYFPADKGLANALYFREFSDILNNLPQKKNLFKIAHIDLSHDLLTVIHMY